MSVCEHVKMLVFATDDDVQLLNADYVYLDGTFKSAPRPYLQFVTIHRRVNDCTLKLGCALLANSNVSMDGSFSSGNRSYTNCDFLERLSGATTK